MYILFCILLLILTIIMKPKWIESFENISEDVGNYMSKYFYHYAVSICKQEDFVFEYNPNVILKHLPTKIPFRPDLYEKFKEKQITLELLGTILDIYLWACKENSMANIWIILKPTIHQIMKEAIEKSGLDRGSKTYIHFRCADTPFIKHVSYCLQRYEFFKDCLEKINPIDKKVTLMNCSTHLSNEKDQAACSLYVDKLADYLKGIGYKVETQCKTNGEDFADLFNAKGVISTGGSFSFMSGFFGKGLFLSTDHSVDHKSCDLDECKTTFLKGYNISHDDVESYHDVDNVYSLLIQ